MDRKVFYLPLLEALAKRGGSAETNIIVEDVFRRTEHLLPPDWYESISSSDEPRWRNSIRWARKDLLDHGLLDKNSPRGIWRLTSEGYRALQTPEIFAARIEFQGDALSQSTNSEVAEVASKGQSARKLPVRFRVKSISDLSLPKFPYLSREQRRVAVKNAESEPSNEIAQYVVAVLTANPLAPPLEESEEAVIRQAQNEYFEHLRLTGKIAVTGRLIGGVAESLSILSTTPEEAHALCHQDPAVLAGRILVLLLPWQLDTTVEQSIPTGFAHKVASESRK